MVTRPPIRLLWGHSALTVALTADADAPVCLTRIEPTDVSRAHADGGSEGDGTRRSGQPLVEVLIAGEGHPWSGPRQVGTTLGARLRYVGHHVETARDWVRIEVEQVDDQAGLQVLTVIRSPRDVPAIQAHTSVRAVGAEPVTLHAVSSLATGAFRPGSGADGIDVYWAENDWLAESRWQRQPLRRRRLPDVDLATHGQRPRGALVMAGHGSWSSGEYLPMGALLDTDTGRAWAFQVEHNGAWRWEVGERLDGVYLAVTGPGDRDHQWRRTLNPGEGFTSVPVGLAIGDAGLESAVAALTAYRRAIVRPHPDRTALPVVFNDFMNTLRGDPTTERLLPLIDAAGSAGAEYFCIDAGWYAEDGAWWDSVGAWEPSRTRFPGGLAEVIDRVRAAGMRPGLWLEPEVVGVRSPLADSLPPDAFFQRDGRRQVENGRYHLDLRHPAAVAHLDATVDRLVSEFGIDYFKLDYNVNPGPGTDVRAESPGAGLLEHNRAHLRWLEGVLDRHPGLVLENCGSGGMRMDYALLARLQLQSTSDQENPLRYPPIAASAPMAVLPEQSASWAYPQPEMSDEEIAFTLVTGMLGRLYLSGHLNRMAADQLALVREGVQAHQAIRGLLARAVPFWPLGLPGWEDGWIALGLRAGGENVLAVWRRPGADAGVDLPMPHLRGVDAEIDVRYPTRLGAWSAEWDAAAGVLRLVGGPAPAARILRLRSPG
ncbi:glycoside hydrolase family 36 protein [Streptomyces sp. 4N509B]|uniref:glycoside hydrolase family 36 protein n=1 Tax=Streptomyces sp. 4N509B TaxID=3457413 RepID=UPI003FD3116C